MYVCMYDLVGCSTTELLETLWLIEGVRGKKPHVTFDLILCAVVTSKKKCLLKMRERICCMCNSFTTLDKQINL